MLLEDVLNRELHDAGIESAGDLAERVAVEPCTRIVPAEAVSHIESFCTNLDPLPFRNREGSRKRRIKLPGLWTNDRSDPDIAQRTCSGICKSRGVEIFQAALIEIRICQHLVRTLIRG